MPSQRLFLADARKTNEEVSNAYQAKMLLFQRPAHHRPKPPPRISDKLMRRCIRARWRWTRPASKKQIREKKEKEEGGQAEIEVASREKNLFSFPPLAQPMPESDHWDDRDRFVLSNGHGLNVQKVCRDLTSPAYEPCMEEPSS